MEERDLGDEPEIEVMSWQDHPWTAEEVRFASEILSHGNVRRAAQAAMPGQYANPPGYAAAGHRMLTRQHIRDYIAYVRAEMASQLVISKDRVLEEIARIGFSNIGEFLVIDDDGVPVTDLSGLTAQQLAAIQEITIDTYVEKGGENEGRAVKSTKIKLAPKMPALEALGKNLKLFTDVLETNTVTPDMAEHMRSRRFRRNDKRQQQENADGHEE